MADRYEYRVTSKWCGFWGGWGSENDIAKHIDTESTSGWRLTREDSSTCLWFWVIPRKKALFIYERLDAAASGRI